jgi:peptidoglycan/LPS O-acetylase OafA/YrhL
MTSVILEKNRFACLDGLRGWAALLVVLHHGMVAVDFALVTGQPIDSRGTWDIWISGTPFFPLASAGSLAVCIFFGLSGFVLTHAYSRSRQSWLALVIRRYVRLGIPMFAGCLVSWMLLNAGLMRPHPAVLITHSSWLNRLVHQQPDFVAAAIEPVRWLFGPSMDHSQAYDAALWTMPIEAGGSLLLITVFVFLRCVEIRSQRLVGYVFLLFAVILCGSPFSLFVFGGALRLLQPTEMPTAEARDRWRLVALLLLGLLFGTVPESIRRWELYDQMTVLASHIVQHAPLLQHSSMSFWHGIGAALILLAVSSGSSIQSSLSGPVGCFLGRISFPLYVLHMPLLLVIECNSIIVCHQLGMTSFSGGLLSLIVFAAAAVAIAAMLTPVIEGGAISLSSWIGNVIDGQMHPLKQKAARFVSDCRTRTVSNG